MRGRVFFLVALLFWGSALSASSLVPSKGQPGQIECVAQLQALELTSLPPQYQSVRTTGQFEPMAATRFEEVLKEIRVGRAQGGVVPIPRNSIRPIKIGALSNLCSPSQPEELESLHALARQELKAQPTETSNKLISLIRHLGFTEFSKLHVTTSGAGNWRRGGRLVKAAVPLNMAETLPPAEWEKTSALMAFLAAEAGLRKELQSQAREAGLPWANLLNPDNIGPAKQALTQLITQAQHHPLALSPLEIKYASVALESATGAYTHFDIFTSGGTHLSVKNALDDIRANFRETQFVSDPVLNQYVHQSIEKYIKASAILGETHLIGFQEEVPPLDPSTLQPLHHLVADKNASDAELELLEEPNGLGAGLGFEILDRIGRTDQLQARGVVYGMFSNIEVLSIDMLAQFGSFRKAAKDIAVVVVPVSEGFTGGHPFEVLNSKGEWVSRLIEGNVVPAEFRAGNETFNTNTIFYTLGVKVRRRIDTEEKYSKNGTPILMGKVNAGLITESEDYSVALLLGHTGSDYQNFKASRDYKKYGHAVVEQWRHVTERQILAQLAN